MSDSPATIWHTFDEWKTLGYRIQAGSKSTCRNAKNMPLFSESQVVALPHASKPNEIPTQVPVQSVGNFQRQAPTAFMDVIKLLPVLTRTELDNLIPRITDRMDELDRKDAESPAAGDPQIQDALERFETKVVGVPPPPPVRELFPPSPPPRQYGDDRIDLFDDDADDRPPFL